MRRATSKIKAAPARARARGPSSPDRILDAAEECFADGGFEGASLRQIARAARANLATVYYHFTSKDGLMSAVFQRRFDPLRREHTLRLQQLEAEYGDQPIPLEILLHALLSPPLHLVASNSRHNRAVTRLLGRVVTDPHTHTQELLRRQHQQLRDAYLAALGRSLPLLPPRDLVWRFQLLWGSLAFVLCNPSKLELVTGGLCDPTDTDEVIHQMISLFAAGFRAPALPRP